MTDVTARLTTAISDRYTLLHEVGQGGMATVYLAEDVRHHRKVAIKVLHPELSAVLGGDRFLKEIELTANLQHPHILPLFDSGSAHGLLYYVMPFIDGETLRARLDRERQLPIPDAVRIAVDVAGALDYAHKRGVVHRDIKPENILLQDGRPLVADFGIALAVQQAGGERMTQTGLSLGTPQYMSPEQATGEREIDARSDVYSLGAVTYEMLTGEPPFTGPTAQAIVAKVITTDPQRLTSQRKSIPMHLEAAVLQALEKMPADRFSSAAEFSKALGDARFETTRTTQNAVTSRMPARNQWRLAAITLAGVSVALAGVVAWQSTRDVPTIPVTRYSVNLDENFISQGTDAPGVSPDGSKYVYTNEEGGLLLRDRNELDASEISGADNAWNPFFSPDGETLGFLMGFPGALMTMPLAGGPKRTVFPDSAYAQGAAWGDDGLIYFIGTSGGVQSLLRIEPSGGRPEVLASPDTARGELAFYWPDVLPGGRAVLVTVWPRKGAPTISAIDLKTRKRHTLGGGVRAMYVGGDILAIVQPDGTVNAVRFNPKKLTTSGKPAAVLTGVRTGGQARIMIAYSRSGTLLYESYAPINQVLRVDRSGSVEPVDPGWTGAFGYVAVSPDGTRLAVAMERNARTDIWSRDLRTGTMTKLASEGTYSYRPFWSLDGERVFFVSDGTGKPALYSVASDGSSPPRLAKENARAVDEGALSRDGEWLLHRVGSGSGRDIYMSRTRGDTVARPLLNGEPEEYSPALSPDGRWLAYGSDESRRSEIYVRPFPDVGRARWQVSRAGGIEPVWSPDGRELFFRTPQGDLVAASVDASSGFRVAGERQLFRTRDYASDSRHRAYSVSPDGRHFYFINVLPGKPSQIIVITNWIEELKAKLAAAN